jgi:fatty acid desaturase
MKYCPSCGKAGVEGMKFCPQCGQSLAGFDLEEKQRYVNRPEAPSKKKNWFERHLHWTAVLTFLGAAVAVGSVYAFYITLDPYISLEAQTAIDCLVASIVLAIGWGWVLRQKQRSLTWLLLAIFVPFGWLSIFLLENKSQQLSFEEKGEEKEVT